MRTAFILTKRTEAVASLVADKLKALVWEEVSNELDQRERLKGSHMEGGESNYKDDGQVHLDGDASEVVHDQADTPPDATERTGRQTEGDLCPCCCNGTIVQDPHWTGRLVCNNCQSNWDKYGA